MGGGGGGCVCRLLGGWRFSETGGTRPLPSAVVHGMAQREPSVLHVSVEALVVSDGSDRAECMLSVSNPSPSISTKFRESSSGCDTLGDIGDRSCGVWNVFAHWT